MIRVIIVVLVVVLSWKIWDYTALPAPASPHHQDFKVKETVRIQDDEDEDDEGCCKDEDEEKVVVLQTPQAVTQHEEEELVVSRIPSTSRV